MSVHNPVYGVDAITFLHPAAWGAPNKGALSDLVSTNPAAFWCSLLDRVAGSGVTALELTIPPAHLASFATAFPRLSDASAALASRGLSLTSAYFFALEQATEMSNQQRRALVDTAARQAEILAELGASELVVGFPLRPSSGARVAPQEDETLTSLAKLAEDIGSATRASGIVTTLHTEAGSRFWTAGDVTHVLAVTDPTLVSFCPDIGHLTLAGEDAGAVILEHRERVSLVHLKDAIGPLPEDGPRGSEAFAWQSGFFRGAGEGVVDWNRVIAILATIDYRGTLMLEIDEVPDPESQVRRALSYIQSVIAQRHDTTRGES